MAKIALIRKVLFSILLNNLLFNLGSATLSGASPEIAANSAHEISSKKFSGSKNSVIIIPDPLSYTHTDPYSDFSFEKEYTYHDHDEDLESPHSYSKYDRSDEDYCACKNYPRYLMDKHTFGKMTFEIYDDEPISEGGTAKVFHAYSSELKKCVAVKKVEMPKPGTLLYHLFLKEVEILKIFAQKEAKRIIRMITYELQKVSEDVEFLWLAMELADEDLSDSWFTLWRNANALYEEISDTSSQVTSEQQTSSSATTETSDYETGTGASLSSRSLSSTKTHSKSKSKIGTSDFKTGIEPPSSQSSVNTHSKTSKLHHRIKRSGPVATKSHGKIDQENHQKSFIKSDSKTIPHTGKIMQKVIDAKIIENIVEEILLALQEMHEEALHLDLKPGNLMYVTVKDGEESKRVLKLIDFNGSELLNKRPKDGAEQVNEEDLLLCEKRQTSFGTLGYSSPEQRQPCKDRFGRKYYKVSQKSDVWAVGIMAYKFLYNRLPFTRKLILEKGVLKQENLHDYIVHPIRLPCEYTFLIDIIEACLQFDPDNRPTVNGLLKFLKKECLLRRPNSIKTKFDCET